MITKNLALLILIFSSLVSAGSLQDQIAAKRLSGKANMTEKKRAVYKEFSRATQELRDSGIEKKAIGKGVQVPRFQIDGKSFSTYYKKSPVILKFYRGHWCPYCMMELKEYQSLYKLIKAKGAQLIALVPDKQSYIERTKRRFNLTFPIYQDKDNAIAKKFGLAFTLDKTVQELYKNFKIDLDSSQGNTNRELPMPGTYVVGTDGKIIYAFFDADYTKRAEPSEVIKLIR